MAASKSMIDSLVTALLLQLLSKYKHEAAKQKTGFEFDNIIQWLTQIVIAKPDSKKVQNIMFRMKIFEISPMFWPNTSLKRLGHGNVCFWPS